MADREPDTEVQLTMVELQLLYLLIDERVQEAEQQRIGCDTSKRLRNKITQAIERLKQ